MAIISHILFYTVLVIFMFYVNIEEASVKASEVAKAVGWSLAMARFEHRQISFPTALAELLDFDSKI